mgnify:CR=1 FL=1
MNALEQAAAQFAGSAITEGVKGAEAHYSAYLRSNPYGPGLP